MQQTTKSSVQFAYEAKQLTKSVCNKSIVGFRKEKDNIQISFGFNPIVWSTAECDRIIGCRGVIEYTEPR